MYTGAMCFQAIIRELVRNRRSKLAQHVKQEFKSVFGDPVPNGSLEDEREEYLSQWKSDIWGLIQRRVTCEGVRMSTGAIRIETHQLKGVVREVPEGEGELGPFEWTTTQMYLKFLYAVSERLVKLGILAKCYSIYEMKVLIYEYARITACSDIMFSRDGTNIESMTIGPPSFEAWIQALVSFIPSLQHRIVVLLVKSGYG